MQRWTSRLGVLIVVWVLFVTAAALWLPHDWDWRVVSFVNAHHTPSFSQRVRIFDVTWDATDNSRNRRRIAGVLDRLVALGARPAAVALDVEFGPCDGPCSPAMESARKKLTASIRGATRLFPVYALEQPTVNHAEDEVVGPLPPHDATIYEAVSGAAHTRFTPLRTTNGIFYRACYRNVPYNGAPGALQVVWSMVDRLALAQMIQGGAPCDTSHVPVYLGEPLHRPGASVYQTSGASNEHFPDVVDDFVIVGTMGPQDQSVYADRSGPELLGWALSNALDLQLAMQIRTVY